MNQNNIDFGAIITSILVIILPIAITYLVAVIAVFVRAIQTLVVAKLHASLTADQLAQAKAFAAVAVTMAEQVWKRPDVQAAFESKKAFAEDYVNRNLDAHHIHLTTSDVEALVESAVYKELHKGQTVSVQTGNVTVAAPTVQTTVEGAAIGSSGSGSGSGGGEGINPLPVPYTTS